jgi:hypothetical protein
MSGANCASMTPDGDCLPMGHVRTHCTAPASLDHRSDLHGRYNSEVFGITGGCRYLAAVPSRFLIGGAILMQRWCRVRRSSR